MNNQAMSSTIATIFLVLITIGALAVLWGVVNAVDGYYAVNSFATFLNP